ncbi:urease subunit alpha [Roseospira marina]|uniref:Urease subunit alpha n=1 Tax=Roseospira marina TaxID=140057 RepID=A0A5M6IGR6_9PROT|nr:urease subunit alpha [Roseospira marina]KAA5607496.1 urease subunit alpha [Roseospira marina]MBB4312323.1 urease subunit alpha [Roseospira marina]MBB5085661.1 urease subunit alpha [Roseospira marina]
MAHVMDRGAYAAQYGPTVGDRVRLADTDLVIEVERDRTTPGEEVTVGAGGVVRDGMGQSQTWRGQAAVDTVIANALILDAERIEKADIGIKDGRIEAIGAAGNPDTQPDIDIVIGPGTEIVDAAGRLVTPGGVDALVTWLDPRQIDDALASGITTMLGGGTGPTAGSRAGASTPGPWHLWRMLQAADGLPVNLGFYGKGSASRPGALEEQISAGAIGLTLHEAWGATPSAIACCLSVAERLNVQVVCHLDRLNESGFAETSLEAFGDQTVHAVVSDPSLRGGPAASDGLALDGLAFCQSATVLPGSAATGAFGAATILHDMGALSILGSGAQAPVEDGGLIARAWQNTHAMKALRGRLPEERGDNDNIRVRRTLAKYTINPALAHGVAEHVGAIAAGRLADLVLWDPAFFGAKPALVLKGGSVVLAGPGDAQPRASDRDPAVLRRSFGAFGRALTQSSVTFVSHEAIATVLGGTLGLRKTLVPVSGCRSVTKADMILNTARPTLEVDRATGTVRLDGAPLTVPPVAERPLTQRYFLF